jgi:hypothetical protein
MVIITKQLINSLEWRTPSEACRNSATEEMYRLLQNPEFHYRARKKLTIGPYRHPDESSTDSPALFLTVHFSIIPSVSQTV